MSLIQFPSPGKARLLEALTIGDRPQDVLRKSLSINLVMLDSSFFVAQYHTALRSNARKNHDGSDFANTSTPSPWGDSSLIAQLDGALVV